ncbi:MAG TPA: hypothetical protein PLZ57_07700 [Pseudobdellovibrionaceae bacterium]|nr:hypothetical protein [Pseudobdellovibrionaceae bacterium]
MPSSLSLDPVRPASRALSNLFLLHCGLSFALAFATSQNASAERLARESVTNRQAPAATTAQAPRSCAIADRFQQSEVSASIARHIERIGGRVSTSSGRCYTAVQNALHRAGAIPYSGIGAAAREAETHLSQFGFVNLMTDPGCRDRFRTPADAPDGAILVYRGGNCPPARRILCGREDCGHVEIRVGSRYISDFASANPVTGSPEATQGGGQRCPAGQGFELIGILVPQN